MNAMAFRANRDAYEAVALAVRLYGHKRGWHLSAQHLGITERAARALVNGETTGASIDPDTAYAARMAFRRARAEQIRAELRELENAECAHGQPSGVSSDGAATSAGTAPNGAPFVRAS